MKIRQTYLPLDMFTLQKITGFYLLYLQALFDKTYFFEYSGILQVILEKIKQF
jgi:hypothetical protein